MFKKMRILVVCLMVGMLLPVSGFADVRSLDGRPDTQTLKVGFNGEKLKVLYNIVDARTEAEKAADLERGSLAGPAIVFIQGHSQRPSDAYKFTNDLALKSRSGLVVIPVCDTPYGAAGEWRGDRGKDVILMEVVRYLLAQQNIAVDGYVPICELPVEIKGAAEDWDQVDGISTKLNFVGWSHGGLLVRRFASAYPNAITGMGQVCPAGFEDWTCGMLGLLTNFAGEAIHIGGASLAGCYVGDALAASWGITKGQVGDSFRGFASGMVHCKPARMFRHIKDMMDCAILADDSNLPLGAIDAVVTVFGRKDTVISPYQTGVADLDNPTDEEVAAFWQRFYPSLVGSDTRLTLKILEGNHLTPLPNHDLISDEILKGLGQLAECAD